MAQYIFHFEVYAQVGVALITDDRHERQMEVVTSGTLLKGVERRVAIQRHLLARRMAPKGIPRTRRCAGNFWIVLTSDNWDPKERSVCDAKHKPDGDLAWRKI